MVVWEICEVGSKEYEYNNSNSRDDNLGKDKRDQKK